MKPVPSPKQIVALAAGCHPDDIELTMAGTLLRLKDAGAEIHMWNLSNGEGGSIRHTPEETARIRTAEAQTSARLAGAIFHPPLFEDLAIFYDRPSLARVAAVVRDIRPTVILTHSPQDYMEDHQNVCRLIVTAAFSRSVRNFTTDPRREAYDAPLALYHALPHCLRDAMNQPIRPDAYVNIGPVLSRKCALLACHTSQKEWLDVTQGEGAYLKGMESMGVEVGRQSGRFALAEG